MITRPMPNYIYEKSLQNEMTSYPWFDSKLKQIEGISRVDLDDEMIGPLIKVFSKGISKRKCKLCNNPPSKIRFYRLGNIIWSNDLFHQMKEHQSYPSDYFIKVIASTLILDDYILNQPLEIESNLIPNFSFVPLCYNQLLIIDALMKQGSEKRYLMEKRGVKRPDVKSDPEYTMQSHPDSSSNPSPSFIYSEHSGVIETRDNTVTNIIVSSQTNRIDEGDESIYLPINTPTMYKHSYLFHTHPNTRTYGGRLGDGIIHEFPSASDVGNFIKFRREGKAQASLVVAPEGIYVIRPIRFSDEIVMVNEDFLRLNRYILKLEGRAVGDLRLEFDDLEDLITDENFFHENVSSNITYIRSLNSYLKSYNVFFEFYPREKRNNEWILRSILLKNVTK